MNSEVLLQMKGITKVYSNGFIANEGIDFSVRKGEIHGLVGENGAGKTTLMKVLFGLEPADKGEIIYKGEEVRIKNPLQALEYGIGMVHQHFMLVPSLTVAENMTLGMEPVKKMGVYDYKKAVQQTIEISERFELPVDPHMKISELSVGYKQRVEILRILLRGAELILLDEPTALLTPQETKELFAQLNKLKELGNTVVFISHKLNEVRELCDRITVLRKGRVVGVADIEDVDESDIARMMVGHDVKQDIEKAPLKQGDVVLQVRNLRYKDRNGSNILNDISFDLHSGEILGIAGVEGNGQSELCDTISGNLSQSSGSIILNGESISEMTIRKRREQGAAFLHEDRMTYGVSQDANISENLFSDRYYKKEYSRFGLLKKKPIDNMTEDLIDFFCIKCDGNDALVSTLSGGNIQKVVVAREFSSNASFLLASHPTRGIDIGSAELIRNNIVSRAENDGMAVLMFSSDFTELLSVSDKIIVMFNGEIVAYFPDLSDINASILGEYMLGLKRQTIEGVVNSEVAN